MVKKCCLCGNPDTPLFQFPSDPFQRSRWFSVIEKFYDLTKITDYTVICLNHFDKECIKLTAKSKRLTINAVPSKFNTPGLRSYISDVPDSEYTSNLYQNVDQSIQVNTISHKEIQNLQYHVKVLTQKLKRANKKIKKLEQEKKNNSNPAVIKSVQQIEADAEQSNEKAMFLLDLIKNYLVKTPKWSEMTIRLCTMWRFCSPKGYEFCKKNLTKIPSKSTILRYIGKFDNQNQLITKRLAAEISELKPIERLCSLIIDDMAIKPKMHYSRAEDVMYGLDNTGPKAIGEKPKIATQMLCFVIHGLSTKYTIPAGYFFHATFTAEKLHMLTMKVLKLLTDSGFIVLRIVTDNATSNVALFKKLCGRNLKNSIQHPFLTHLPIFLSFDYCHAVKNSRNLFLSHDMCSSEGVISSSFLKSLHELQQGLPVKPVKFLTKKHLYPSNFEKMNVRRAVEIFSPPVTAALKFLNEAKHGAFKQVDSTISYMENMYKFFQTHNVSNRTYYIHSLDSNVAPYTDITDERLEWLSTTFPKYIDDIQNNSPLAGLQGLSKETAHALKFTAQSTCLCIKFLLEQVGFYYILTRSFSSDAVEAMFSNVRLKGGSNDATDARAAEYALRQLLRCGIVKSSTSANISNDITFVSVARNPQTLKQDFKDAQAEEIILPLELRNKIEQLPLSAEVEANISSASIAFLGGYIINKIKGKFACDACVAPLLTTTMPGPLLQLIAMQDRGGLTYPNAMFVGLVKRIADIGQQVLPFLKPELISQQLMRCLHPMVIKNPLFCCSDHKSKICELIITAVIKPVLNNICLETTDSLKRKPLTNKPLSRKVFKIN